MFGALTISKVVTLPSLVHNSSGVKILEPYIPIILVVQTIDIYSLYLLKSLSLAILKGET